MRSFTEMLHHQEILLACQYAAKGQESYPTEVLPVVLVILKPGYNKTNLSIRR